jgi:hypothetical protein
VGRNPSGSARTGQAKMGSRARRGRGARSHRGRSALGLRCRQVGVSAAEPGWGLDLGPSDVYLWLKIPRAEITDSAPQAPSPRKLLPRGRAGLQSGEQRLEGEEGRKASIPALSLFPGLQSPGSPSALGFPLQKTFETAPQQW